MMMYVLIIDSFGICPNNRHRASGKNLEVFHVLWNVGCISVDKRFQNFLPFPLFETPMLDAPVDLQDEGLGVFAVCFFTKVDDTDREKHTEQIPEQLFLPRFLLTPQLHRKLSALFWDFHFQRRLCSHQYSGRPLEVHREGCREDRIETTRQTSSDQIPGRIFL